MTEGQKNPTRPLTLQRSYKDEVMAHDAITFSGLRYCGAANTIRCDRGSVAPFHLPTGPM